MSLVVCALSGGKGIVPLDGVLLGETEIEDVGLGELEGVLLGVMLGSRLAVAVELG